MLAISLRHTQQNAFEPWNNNLLWWGNVPVYDIRLKWVGIASYDLPWGSNLHGVAHGFLAGWQTNFVAFWSTGLDFTIFDAASQMNVGLGEIGKRLGRKALAQVACVAKPATILAWYARGETNRKS